MTRPLCLRRRKKRKEECEEDLAVWSIRSLTTAYGGASGTQLDSNIAGVWPPWPMGHRLVMPSGGRRG